jgi:branched-chain amino acid transport system permease protein
LLAGLALAAIGQGLALGFFGPESHTYPADVLPPGDFTAGSVVAGWLQLLAPVAAIVLVLLVRWLLRASRYGLALRAIAENPRAARLLGIDVERLIAQTFFLSSALGGVAGTLFALSVNSAAVGMDQPVELRGLAIIILGGMGSVPGAIVGGFALALIEVFSGPMVGVQYRDAIPFAVLFLVLALRPSGLLGRHALRAA